MSGTRKAYAVYERDGYSEWAELIFAETPGQAKRRSEQYREGEVDDWLDLRARRVPSLDRYANDPDQEWSYETIPPIDLIRANWRVPCEDCWREVEPTERYWTDDQGWVWCEHCGVRRFTQRTYHQGVTQ